MGLYNWLSSPDPTAPFVLTYLQLDPQVCKRFRDAWIADHELAVYTRLGGNNRSRYPEVFELIRKHPHYLRDVDDQFDNTYCTFFFSVPEQYKGEVDSYLEKFGPGMTGDQRWKAGFERLEIAIPPELQRAAEQSEAMAVPPPVEEPFRATLTLPKEGGPYRAVSRTTAAGKRGIEFIWRDKAEDAARRLNNGDAHEVDFRWVERIDPDRKWERWQVWIVIRVEK